MIRRQLHFIHIGKTGGIAIKSDLGPHTREGLYRIILHGHRITLSDIPKRAWFFFSIRDPTDRFVSGFYSRRRQGMPRFQIPWSAEEATAFQRFSTANELAESLSTRERQTRQAAQDAMRAIQHVRDSYWHWFRDSAYFLSRSEKILYVLQQRWLDEDFARLVELLGLDPITVVLSQDDLAAHRNPSDVDRYLSERAKQNLSR